MARKKPFLIVAHIKTRRVELVVEWPYENNNATIDVPLYTKQKQLFSHYSPGEFDIIITRSKSFDILKKEFPEFHGWEKAKREILTP